MHVYYLKIFTLSGKESSIEVILNNDAKTFQWSREGIYDEHIIVNGRKSWRSTENAIWYVPQYNSWAVGSLDAIGGTIRGITSTDGSGNNDPHNVPSNDWWYWNNGWNRANGIDDIIIQLVESKY